MADTNDHLYTSADFKRKLFERLNGISAAFNVNYPINPKLRYEYPPINATTLENILSALVANPKFYTQTLHLMNKMNLPCPLVSFVRRPRTTGNLSSFFDAPNNSSSLMNDPMQISSASEAESELEVEEEPQVKTPSQIESKPKKLKVKSFLKTQEMLSAQCDSAKKKVSVNEAFEKENENSKQKSIIKKSQLTTNAYDRKVIPVTDGFSKIIPFDKCIEDFTKNDEQTKTVVSSELKFISKSDLEQNRLKLAELKELPVYRKYERGEPNSRIYLKNLHKDVTDTDLKFIYGSFIDWRNEEHVNSFDIRLMKEGRMKGQAFITFPNEETASKALIETNGYLLKDKPIIISFARSAKPK